MEAFEILGIAPTKDVKEIRRAYSKLMTQFSPEKDPEGFQRLRSAYEEALVKAKNQEGSDEKILSPIDEFMKAFEENYRCFERRIDLKSWEEMLEKDICYNIDSSKEINHRILTFIMDDYNFTTEVWILFNNYFSWTAKKDSLYNNYPRNFIDFIVYKVNNKSTFDYESLKQCKENEQDKFIKEYRNLNNALDQFDLYTADRSIKAAEKISRQHPNLLILTGKYFSLIGRKEEALNIFTSLINNNKEDLDVFFCRADLYYGIGKLEEAYNDYKRALNINENSAGTWYSLAKCCLCLKKYEEAIEYSEKLNGLSEYRQDITVILNSAYNFYIDTILENKEQDYLDKELKFKLANAYFKISKIEESYDILQELMQSNEYTSSIYYLFCRVLMVQKNIELAYFNVCKALYLYKDDYDLNFLKADILDDLGKYEESIAQYDKIMILNKDKSAIYNNKAYVLNKINRYNEALECANMAINIEPEAANTYKNKAGALLGLKLYEDCLDACEQALSKYQYLTEVYIIKMKAFIDMDALEEALSVYNKTSDWGLKDSNLYYQKARVLMYSRKYEDSIEYCDLAIELDENNAEFYYLKGSILQDLKKYEESIVEYKKAIEYEPIASYYFSIGYAYSELDKYSQAIEYYNTFLELEPNQLNGHANMSYCLYNMGKYNECIEYCNNAINIDHEYVLAHQNKGWALYKLNDIEKAEIECNIALKLDGNREDVLLLKLRILEFKELSQEALIVCDRMLELNPNYDAIKATKRSLLERGKEKKKGFLKALFK